MPISRIQILPTALADQIAAGEVVERPASVVKEMVENALDAGARRIEIECTGGGRELLRISDDGTGMSPEEATLSLKRHATSKLHVFEELLDLKTMGFRGEALPSIAAVSRLTLTTRSDDSIEGFRLLVEGGTEHPGQPVGAPRGTTFEVRDLFYNVPARLKFLKADATETAHVVDAVLRVALANPSVHFRLRSGSDGKPLLELPPHRSAVERAQAGLSRRGAIRLHLGEGSEAGVNVVACLGSPSESATTSRNTFIYVNRRFVRDRGLLQALALGYGELLERGRYPHAVIHVEVPAGAVDVNVHPQKTEVRFVRPQDVYAAVRHVVRQSCAKAPWLDEAPEQARSAMRVYDLPPPPVAAARERGGYEARNTDGGRGRAGFTQDRLDEALALFGPRNSGKNVDPLLSEASPVSAISPVDAASAPATSGTAAFMPVSDPRSNGAAFAAPRGFFSSLRYLGQVHKTYLVCEAEGELVLLDQHAAHERVAFERLKNAHMQQRVRTQRLLFPHALELDETQAAAAVEHAEVLSALGFEIEPFGGGAFAVKAVPELVGGAAIGPILTDVLDELAARGGSEVVADRLDHLFATMACHSVVRAGDLLDAARVRALLDSMDGIDFRAHCPHGRPVLLRMSLGELERRFGRT